MTRRALVSAALALCGCHDWTQGLEACRAAGGCFVPGSVGGGSASATTLQIEPGFLDAGRVVTTERTTVAFTVRNVGSNTANGVSLFTTVTPPFTVTGPCSGATLAPDASCDATVTFEPASLGRVEADVRASATEAPGVTVTVAGQGVTPLLAEPATLDFMTVPIGATATRTITVTSQWRTRPTGPLTVMAGAGPFVIANPGTCTGALAPLGQCSFDVRFAPLTAGRSMATAIVRSQPAPPRPDEVATVQLDGNAVPGLGLTPSQWNPMIEQGTSTSQDFVVSNSLPAALSPLTLSISGAAFVLDAGTCGGSLAPMDMCTASVRFIPPDAGMYPGQLVVSAAGTMASATLLGRSDAYFTLTITPSSNGAVSIPALGITCPGGACSVRSRGGVQIMVTAVPNAGFEFEKWTGTGICSTNGNPCGTFTYITDQTLAASFWLARKHLLITPPDAGRVEVLPGATVCPPNCDVPVAPDQRVLLRPRYLPYGYTVESWGGDCPLATGDFCPLVMSASRSASLTIAPANLVFLAQNVTFTSPGPAAADGQCQDQARDAGLPGATTYVSWLTDSSRVQTQGWVNGDGHPFAASLTDLLSTPSALRYPARWNAKGQIVLWSTRSFTGIRADGGPGPNCTSWSGTGMAVDGNPTAGNGLWTEASTSATCAAAGTIYCFGNFDAGVYRRPAMPPGERIAFVSEGTGVGTVNDATADAICANEAQDAGLTGSFVAARANLTRSALSRFDLDGGGWYRTDGVALFPWAPDMVGFADPLAPLDVNAWGKTVSSFAPCAWTGTQGATGANCGNWTNTFNGASTGMVHTLTGANVNDDWLGHPAFNCGNTCRYYCFQQ